MRIILIFIVLAILTTIFVLLAFNAKAQEAVKTNTGFVSQPICVKYNKGDLYNPYGNEKPWWLTEKEYHSYDDVFNSYIVRCSVKAGPGGVNFVRWNNK